MSRKCFLILLGIASSYAAMLAATSNAGTVRLYDWEAGLEGWTYFGTNVLLSNSNTLGVTHGSQSLVLDNLTSGFKGNATFNPGSAKVTSGPIFDAWTQIANSYVGGATDLKLEFDFTYDNSSLTSNAFAQFSVYINSALGFTQYNTGQLLQGNTGGGGTIFPARGSQATTDGVVLTPIGVNAIHVAIPFAGPDPDGIVGPLTGGVLGVGPGTFYEIGFKTNGGWGGTLDWAVDNLVVTGASVPEPSSWMLLGLATIAALSTRKVLVA